MAEYIEREKIVNRLKMWLMDLENDMDKGDYGELSENKGAREAIESCICEIEEQKAADVQPAKHGHWIEKSEEYYRLWRDRGRSWADMPYFITGLNFACGVCLDKYDTNTDDVEFWDFCPHCGADMRGEENAESNR